MAKVLHFIRKKSQFQSSFILNQVTRSIDYDSYLTFAIEDSSTLPIHPDSPNPKAIEPLNHHCTIRRKIQSSFPGLILFPQQQAIQSVIEKVQPTVLHFHYGSDAGLFLKWTARYPIPKIVSFYGYDAYSFPKRFRGLGSSYLKNRVFRYADAVLAMSPEMKQDLLKCGCPDNKIIVHYHGVPDKLSKLTRHFEEKERVNLLMLSYLDPVKGHSFVLDALNNLVQSGIKNFHLNIVGDGFYLPVLRKKVDKLKLTGYVSFLGRVEYLSESYFNTFVHADIFLHPSVITLEDKEGIPGSLVEAMFAGLPVISTYHGGIPYVIRNNKTGILVEEWDVPALAKAISTLSHSVTERKRLGTAARQYALNNLRLEEKQRDLEQIYLRLQHSINPNT